MEVGILKEGEVGVKEVALTLNSAVEGGI